MLRRFQQQHLAQLTNYRWLKYASILWSLRIACIAIAVCIPLISQLLLLYFDSSRHQIPATLQLPVYEANDLTSPRFSHQPYVIKGISLPSSLRLDLFQLLPSLISSVKISRDPYFQYFASDKQWHSKVITHNTTSMLFSDFMSQCYGPGSSLLLHHSEQQQADKRHSYYYYSHAAPHDLASLLPPILPNIEPEFRVWFSSPGTVVQPHYDMEHNFFLQLTGSKTFLLASPEHYSIYAPHSLLHTQWRQAQNKFILQKDDLIALGVKAGLYNESAYASGVYEVTLQPGDLLYIPAFYFHTVSAHEDSVSLNAWVGSNAYDISQKLPRIAVPYQVSDSQSRKLVSVFVFAKLLCLRLNLDIYSLQRSLMQRYEGICIDSCNNVQSLDDNFCEVHESISKDELQLLLTSKIAKRGLEAAAAALSQASPSIRSLLLMDYIEQLLEFSLDPKVVTPCRLLGIVTAWKEHINR